MLSLPFWKDAFQKSLEGILQAMFFSVISSKLGFILHCLLYSVKGIFADGLLYPSIFCEICR